MAAKNSHQSKLASNSYQAENGVECPSAIGSSKDCSLTETVVVPFRVMPESDGEISRVYYYFFILNVIKFSVIFRTLFPIYLLIINLCCNTIRSKLLNRQNSNVCFMWQIVLYCFP